MVAETRNVNTTGNAILIIRKVRTPDWLSLELASENYAGLRNSATTSKSDSKVRNPSLPCAMDQSSSS